VRRNYELVEAVSYLGLSVSTVQTIPEIVNVAAEND
jgi:hypothetical protein